MIVLSATGLAAADVSTYTSLRSFLLDRTDRSLQSSHFGIERAVLDGDWCGAGAGRTAPGGVPGDFVEVRDLDGQVLCSLQVKRFSEPAPSPPRLPAAIAVPPPGEDPERPRYFTVPAKDGGDRYRVRARRSRTHASCSSSRPPCGTSTPRFGASS